MLFLESAILWDHPRVCGEHFSRFHEILCGEGSSPRMRGTPATIPPSARLTGIIPAYAGNTWLNVVLAVASRDHPRVCGEHETLVTDGTGKQGSSPRMRGTPSRRCSRFPRPGIIPAYAGNTSCFTYTVGALGDHPRVCGEHVAGGRDRTKPAGSSPRMRGTRQRRGFFVYNCRIIPAYAGNTGSGCGGSPPPGDHPRVCGEHWS